MKPEPKHPSYNETSKCNVNTVSNFVGAGFCVNKMELTSIKFLSPKWKLKLYHLWITSFFSHSLYISLSEFGGPDSWWFCWVSSVQCCDFISELPLSWKCTALDSKHYSLRCLSTKVCQLCSRRRISGATILLHEDV